LTVCKSSRICFVEQSLDYDPKVPHRRCAMGDF
jgi:hypothetical protein